MEKCPVCGAKYFGKQICHRCQTDFKCFLDIEKEAFFLKQEAVKAFVKGDYQKMFQRAVQSAALKSDGEAFKLSACAAWLSGDFAQALVYNAKARRHSLNGKTKN